EERAYDVHQTMHANISSPLFGEEPLSLDVTQVIGWKGVSVDDAGTGTIEVTVSDMSGAGNGTGGPGAPAGGRRPDPGVRVPRDGTAHPDPAGRRRRGLGRRHVGQGVLAGLPVR